MWVRAWGSTILGHAVHSAAGLCRRRRRRPFGCAPDGWRVWEPQQPDPHCRDWLGRWPGGALNEPTKRNLPQARPNPSSSGAQVEFQLLAPGQVSLQIFDLGGRRVRELTAPFSTAGRQFFRWDGHDDAGRAVPSGNYFWLLSKVRVDWVPGRIVELGPHQSKRS
ncbi:MAG: hypothetical protein IPK72_10890 [Candidatus Eisenbacteria bacterium]|nr:hypothetical protein [Candidatus Eisenbacteria bacterium]